VLSILKYLHIFVVLLIGSYPALPVADQEVEYRSGAPKFEEVWNQFYADPGHEPELADTLINARRKMTGTICEAIKHIDMKCRRYAIEPLGFIGDNRALPTLQIILKDEKEKDYFHGDALKAIYLIDERLGTTYANEFIGSNEYLTMIGKAILTKASWLKERPKED